MNDPLPELFQDLLWRRKLTAEERATLDAWLAKHPEVREALLDDLALTSALERLPDVPVATNFTARVLEEAERVVRAAARSGPPVLAPWRRLAVWLPRTAVAALVIGVSLFGWHQHRATVRAELARSMAENIAQLGPDVFENFDPILLVSPIAPDQPLLSALERPVE